MKKRIILIIFLFISIFTFSNERIKEYKVEINVNKNGSVLVNEYITYNPGDLNKRGLIRFIPYYYPNGKFLENKVAIKDFEVRYINPLQRDVNFIENKNRYNMVYKIGSSNEWLIPNEDYTYFMSYKMYNVLREKDGIYQIYFNAIGNNWDMPIENASIKINGISGDLKVYTGQKGKKNQAFKLENNKIVASKTLQAGEGISILLNSKDFKMSKFDLWKNRLFAYKSLVFVFFVILISFIFNIIAIFIRYINKIKDRVMTEFDCFSVEPIMAKYIDKTYQYRDLMIVIYQLVSKDIIKYREKNPLHEQEYEEYVRKENEIRKEKIKKYNDYIEKQYYIDTEVLDQKYSSLSIYEKKALEKLFLAKNDIFKNKKILYKAEIALNKYSNQIYNEKYILKTYPLLLAIYIVTTGILTLTIIFDFEINIFTILAIIFVILTVLNLITLRKYKKEYKADYLRVKGFKKFLLNVEKKSFERFIDVQDIIKYFKNILPYALALGLENQYLKLLDKAIQTYDLDREYMYDNVMYYYLYDRYLFNNMINESFAQNTNFSSSTSSFSGSFTSSGSSGGGFGGGGGSSW